MLGAVIVPYLARVPGTVFHGLDWLQQYLPAELLGEGLLALAVLLILNSRQGSSLQQFRTDCPGHGSRSLPR